MKKHISLGSGFLAKTVRRKGGSNQQKIKKQRRLIQQKSFDQLAEIFRRYIPTSLLEKSASGAFSRWRIFSKSNLFWTFLYQILHPDGGCAEVVKKLQAQAAERGLAVPSSSTASYCVARGKLDESLTHTIFTHTAQAARQIPDSGPFKGREVIVVDGTGLLMPDTELNQEQWPQSSNQKPGCGFPSARILACFSLFTGAMLSYRIGNKKSHELRLLRNQLDTLKPESILLGDKAFCSYFDLHQLKTRCVDAVITLARRTPVSACNAIKVLGPNDLLISWKRPAWNKKSSITKEDWNTLPETMSLRQIHVTVAHPGFRVQSFTIVTTLLNPSLYPAEHIADLYLQRWDVELFFRDIKITMNIEMLRCKTPSMIRKEICMSFIAYNCIRLIMFDAAKKAKLSNRQISFKGTLQTILHWEPQLNRHQSPKKLRRLVAELYKTITKKKLFKRPGRREPRVVKQRPKPHQLLTEPRSTMKETPHRGKYSKKRLN